MATKNHLLFFKDKRENSFITDQYSNLNLNHNNQLLNNDGISTNFVINDSRKSSKYDLTATNNSQKTNDTFLWGNSKKNLSLTYLNMDHGSEIKKIKENSSKNSRSSSSTLSLHISAYENSIGTQNLEVKKEKSKLIKKWKNTKQLLDISVSVVAQNPFEFPRQQNEIEASDPEVMQFKASQKLFNSNQQLISAAAPTLINDSNIMATNNIPSTSSAPMDDEDVILLDLDSNVEQNAANIPVTEASTSNNATSSTVNDSTAAAATEAATTSQKPERTDDEYVAQICVETILKLLSDPHKMCHLLKLNDSTNYQQKSTAENEGEPTLPEIVFSLRKAFSDRAVLSRAARHFQNISDDSLYYLTTIIPSSRDMDDILKTVIEETHCMTPDGLEKLINYLCDLIAETVPKKFRLDKMLSMTPEELEEAEQLLPDFDGEYNRDDWLALCTSYSRGGVYRMFDSSNITLQDVLKEFATQYKGKIVEELWSCSKNAAEYRASDSKYQKAFTCADAPDYEKIYKFLSTMAGCRNVTTKDINKMDAAVVTNIFQEMEELIALNFDTFGRQMPILLEQMKGGDCVPDTGFNEEDVAKIEANPLHLPEEFRNPYNFEMKRRALHEANKIKEAAKEELITEGPEMEE